MRIPRFVRFASGSAVLALLMFAACSEVPQAPTARADRAFNASAAYNLTGTSDTVVTGLQWSSPVSQKTVSMVIGPAGGTVSLPQGLRIIVPPGAVSANVTFSITRLPGNIVAYNFQPHGITFAAPLQLQQPTLGTNLFKGPVVTSILGAYFPDETTLDQSTGTAKVTEFEPTFVSADNAWITFSIRHFSGYLVAMGHH